MKAPISRAVLLVGGKGTRLRPLTYQRPKALIPLLDEPLIAFELRLLARYGITDIVLACGYKAELLEGFLGDGSRWGVQLTYVEDPVPLGTAGAIKNVQTHIDGPFVCMNGDLVYDVDLAELTAAHVSRGAMVTFCLRRVTDIRRFGLIRSDDAGWVTDFLEKQEQDETGRNTVNSGVYVMSPEVLEYIPKGEEYSNETQLFPGLLREGRPLLGHVPAAQGYWADVGTIDSYRDTTRDLLHGAVPWLPVGVSAEAVVSEGATLVAPVMVGAGATVGRGATVGPDVVVGARASVGQGAVVAESILWDNAQVGESCRISQSVIASGAVVSPGSELSGEVAVP